MRFVGLLIALSVLLSCGTVEARGWRPFRGSCRNGSCGVSVTTTVEFSGNAQAVCEQKAAFQAARCSMFHPGGSFGGGSCEGVACAGDPQSALDNCCYSNSGRTIIGQAVVRGANGLYYACRIFR